MTSKNWRSVLSIALGSVAVCIPFVIREIDFAALGEPTGTVLAVTLTWLPVICAPLGLVLAIAGVAFDQSRALAIAAFLMNGLAIGAAALILYVLTG